MKNTIKILLTTLFSVLMFTFLFENSFIPEVNAQTQIPGAPEAFTATIDSLDNSVHLTWQYDSSVNSYADGFMIYKSTAKNGNYEYFDDVYSNFSDSYSLYDDYIVEGVTYYYKIVAYVEDDENYQTITGPEVFSNMVQIPLAKPVVQSAVSSASHSISIRWTPVSYADGYYIYRSINATSGYTLIYTYNASGSSYYNSWDLDDSLSHTDKGLTVGKTYYYKVCPFVKYDNQIFTGSFSNYKSAIVRIDAAKITKSSSKKKSTNTITWKKVSEADGYIVYYSKKYNGTYKKLKTLKGNKKLSYTHKKLKNGVAYYYKVYAYKNIGGKPLTSNEPETYLKYCDYYSYAAESYESRHKRIFGNKNITGYKSSKKAMKNMKTIKIKVWDINSKGKKYTRKFSLTVHKNIAPSMKQMFKEIFKSKEKFPIHDIGCYSWRGNNSTSEHCIGVALDINANENYMIQGKTILAGSFWKPKKNKYSIPLKCDLVNILEKYGFSRGFWGERKDYMHFSYFGT